MTIYQPLADTFYKVDDQLVCDDCLWDYTGTEKLGRVAVMCRPVGEQCAKCGREVTELCPAGGEHTWDWHAEDGSGRPITPGIYCEECGERGSDEATAAALRNRITTLRVSALRS